MIFIIISLVILVVLGVLFFVKNSKSKNIAEKLQQLEKENAVLTVKSDSLNKLEQENQTLKALVETEKQAAFDAIRAKSVAESSFEQLQKNYSDLKSELIAEKVKIDNYINEIKESKAVVSSLQSQLNAQAKANTEKENTFKTEFENLANKIFEDNSRKLSEKNHENLSNLLNPVRTQLTDFKQKVEDVYDKESKDRSALKQELLQLKELNQKMSEEAHNLTVALKGDKKQQGNWGEIVLERVLENSGLRKDEEYSREVALKDSEDKSFRPDVVVKLPNNRDIVIDAKTSLNAYDNYTSVTDEREKARYLREHIQAIKNHVTSLADKDYEKLDGINSLDFIFMFIPIENALMLALENDTNLYDRAFKQKIILVSPTTLLLALKVVENTWKYEKQNKSINDIYTRAEELYKKFVGFVEDLEKIGKSLADANKSYEGAFGKLKSGRGNLIGQVEKLKVVSNISTKKELRENLVENALEQL